MPQGIEKVTIQLKDTPTKVYAIGNKLFLWKVPIVVLQNWGLIQIIVAPYIYWKMYRIINNWIAAKRLPQGPSGSGSWCGTDGLGQYKTGIGQIWFCHFCEWILFASFATSRSSFLCCCVVAFFNITKTQALNSSQKLKEKTQPQGGTFLLLRETQEKNLILPKLF